jgi:predicted RND superfamily exporter protein
MTGPGPRTRAFVEWILAHGRVLWTIALLLAVPSAFRTALLYAHLKSDIEALLPHEAPSARAIDELRARMPGLQYLGVIVDTGTAENLPKGEAFVDDLARRIRAYPKGLVRRVRTGAAEEREFLERHAPLYVELSDLREIRRRIEQRRDYEVAKGLDLSIEDDPAPPLSFEDLRAKYEKRAGGGHAATEHDRFSSAEKHATMLLVELAEFETGRGRGAELLSRVQADVRALGGPERYAPGMRVGYTGDVAISVEETSALMQDLSLSSVLVVVAVAAVVLLYYRWWPSLVVLVAPLLLATLYSFALASLPPFGVTELNSNTAFLGSIIVGNGINFGILLVARYVEERRRGAPVQEALVTASWGSRAGTLAASLAAGSSYAALSFTEFQGFRQFGVIGGIGMVVSWVTAQVLIPPLVSWIESAPNRAPARHGSGPLVTAFVARAVGRAPAAIAVAALVLTAFAAWRVRSLSAASLEYDFSKLRRADTWVSGEGYWGRRMDALLGAYLTPMVVLTDSKEEARAIGARLRRDRERSPLADFVAEVRTAEDVLPREQAEKLAEARAIRRLVTPRMRAALTDEQRRTLDRFLGSASDGEIRESDLPPTFTAGLRERDGHIDRAVLVYPKPSHALWEGPAIERFVSALRNVAAASPGRPGRVAGSLSLSADILARIRHDGPLASAIAFFGAAATVLVVFRLSATSALVLGSLVVGVLWLAASTVVLGVRINFANFIAFPITFGIGVDYAVNVMTRYVQDGSRDVGAAIRSTGGAVGLCSLTTIIGYSSLLLAENRALFLFGVLAVLGEIACLTTAIVALPAVLDAWNQRRGLAGPAARREPEVDGAGLRMR